MVEGEMTLLPAGYACAATPSMMMRKAASRDAARNPREQGRTHRPAVFTSIADA
jgi:hypothetical protein